MAYAIPDAYPVSDGHTLIIPKRHIVSLFDATADEVKALFSLMKTVRQKLLQIYVPDGFNIGVNDGQAAGQTVMHLHIHLIPRYQGDTQEPRGGIRWLMPAKACYWKLS